MMNYLTLAPGYALDQHSSAEIKLADLQHWCEGYIECPYAPGLNEAGISMWSNEESLLIGMQPNFAYLVHGEAVVICGPAVFTGHDDEGNTIGLTPDQEQKVRAFVSKARDTLLLLGAL